MTKNVRVSSLILCSLLITYSSDHLIAKPTPKASKSPKAPNAKKNFNCHHLNVAGPLNIAHAFNSPNAASSSSSSLSQVASLPMQTTNASNSKNDFSCNNLYVAGQINMGNSNLQWQKQITSSLASSLPLLNINFSQLKGSQAPCGAYINLVILLAGTASNTPSEYLYLARMYVVPGSSSSGLCQIDFIDEGGSPIFGDNSAVLHAQVSGTGTSAILSLQSSEVMSNISATIYYSLASSNLNSIS
jgi:hypothetical protein